ncbi:MAG TPA: hypothetical protein VGP80_09260 [Gemmatimonadales bacterium]|jgi:hypothetical protein|nr:hypothetical protein [Gemmatimonadales bacterium]
MASRSKTSGGIPFWALAFLVWLGFAMVAVGGGIFRVIWLDPRIGTYAANLVETLGLTAFLGGIIWVTVPWLVPALGKRELMRLGVCWFCLTVAFEFLFGHFVDGASWSALLSNYDVRAGRLWVLVPLMMGFGPSLAGWTRRRVAETPILVSH